MYTEIIFKANIKNDIPKEVDDVLRYLTCEDANSPYLTLFDDPKVPDIDHAFFKCPRWNLISRCSSCYHTPTVFRFYDGFYLFFRADLKCYDNEIDLFVDWISPYLWGDSDKCIGWKWYEEFDSPTLLFPKVESIQANKLVGTTPLPNNFLTITDN